MTRVFGLIRPSTDSTQDFGLWRRWEYELHENGHQEPIQRLTVDYRDTPALRALVAPLGTREDALCWLEAQWVKARYPGDEQALTALAWLIKLVDLGPGDEGDDDG